MPKSGVYAKRISGGALFHLPRKDALGYLRAHYDPPRHLAGGTRHRAFVCVQAHRRADFLKHDMIGYWLTHVKQLQAERRLGQPVCAYLTHHDDVGLWWPSEDATFVVVFAESTGQIPKTPVEFLLRQFPSTLTEADLKLTYDQWAAREVDRRLADLASPEPERVALAARHLNVLTGRLDAETFLKGDRPARDRAAKDFRAWWDGARAGFKHRAKVVMGMRPGWRRESPPLAKKNDHQVRLERVELPPVDSGWVRINKYQYPEKEFKPLRERHTPVAAMRAEYRSVRGTGGDELNAGVVIYPASAYLVHDVIGRWLVEAESIALEQRRGRRVFFVKEANSSSHALLWLSAKADYTVVVSIYMEHNKSTFPSELVRALMTQLPSTLGPDDVATDFARWSVREIDRAIDELPSEDPNVRRRAARAIGRLTGPTRWREFAGFLQADRPARDRFIADTRRWWKANRQTFKPRTKRLRE